MDERYNKSLAWFRKEVGISQSTGYRWLSTGKVPPECLVQHDTGTYRFCETAVQRWLKRLRVHNEPPGAE